MSKDNAVLMIDIGGDSLKLAEFVFGAEGAIILRNFAFRKMHIGDGVDLLTSFKENYLSLISEGGFTARSVRLSLSGQSAFCRLNKLPPLGSNSSAVEKIVAFEAKMQIPYPLQEVVWDYQLICHKWEELRQEEDEEGNISDVSEYHEDYEALYVAIKNDQITMFTDIIQDSGRDILSVEIAPIALYNVAKASGQCREDECVLMLNIGSHSSNLIISDHNRVFVRSIPIAGNSITNQIAKEFGISFKDAEELKRRHGFVALGGAYEEPELEVAATISKIARNVMTKLHGDINRSINSWRSQHGGNAPSRILLAGGGSTMLYVPEFFQEKLHIPVAYLNTFATIAIEDSVNKEELQNVAPMFQELIGMSLRNITQCPVDISLIPNSIKAQKMLDRKKPFFYIAIASLLICICVFVGGINRRSNFDKNMVKMAQAEVDKTSKDLKDVTRKFKERNAAEAEFNSVNAILNERTKWTNILNELQTILPDTMWLTTLEGVGTPEIKVEAAPAGDMGFGGFGGFDEPAAPKVETLSDGLSPDTKEITELRLKGYSLVLDRDLLEIEFLSKIKDSKYFVDEGKKSLRNFEPNTEALNMTSFVINLKLKEPIKK